MKHLLITVLSIASIFVACTSSGQEKEHNKANQHMHNTSFDNLVHHFDNPERDKWQKPDLVIAKLGDISNKIIGDIGSGTGYFSFRLAKKAKKVIAIDVDKRFQEFIAEKKKKEKVTNLETRLVAYDDPHLKDGELDIIITVNTYHHINDRVAYLKKCLKGMKKEGVFFIVDFKKEELDVGPPLDHKIAEKKAVEELKKAGFKNITVDRTSLAYQYMIKAEK